ncbi:MAG: AAA family ATPase [Tannerellaceae bacterium]|jgi:predicted ATP-dependent endonuclease of OLD family|nr:AAA family ATPase [Tannerellaceae bacterium]
MMNDELFLTSIKVKKLLHLQDFDIPLSAEEKKHLVITGRNGSGKTILLNAVLDFWEQFRMRYSLAFAPHEFSKVLESVGLFFNNTVMKEIHERDFIIAFYEAERQVKMQEPISPVKPDLSPVSLKGKKTGQFLNFLVDYKIQEALARNEKQEEDANKIADWFHSFTGLLKEIFEDDSLTLIFNYRDYSFRINSQGKEFKFTQLAAGYSAVLEIVTDLILKMQTPESLTRAYDKQGIVLIDEIETHLHLKLQRLILPILTRIFPNIQFIVTTHSPFVLNSLPNIVAFDLERRVPIKDLTAYSYESLAEGYFGVKTDSSDIQLRLSRLNDLIDKKELTVSEEIEMKELIDDFDKIPEAVAPSIKAAYYQLKLKYNKKEAGNDPG